MKQRTLKVLFDWDAVIRNPCSGFYTFGTSLVKALSMYEGKELSLTLFCQKRYLERSRKILNRLNLENIPLKGLNFKFRWLESLWNIFPYPSLDLLFGRFDIFHSFHHFMPPAFSGKKILTVHDLRRYRLPKLYPKSRLRPFEMAVKRADHFICISEATKRDLMELFDISSKRIDVVYLSCQIPKEARIPKERIRKRLTREYGLDCREFFLAISSKDKRKNIEHIARSFLEIRKGAKDIGLIIVGTLPKDLAHISELDGVHAIGPVKSIYPWLRASLALIFVSLYEGFGLPILEAFSVDTPVITSNSSSMKEIASYAGILVDPRSKRELVDAMKIILRDKEKSQEMAFLGKKRLKGFSWEKTAQKILEVYKKVAGG